MENIKGGVARVPAKSGMVEEAKVRNESIFY